MDAIPPVLGLTIITNSSSTSLAIGSAVAVVATSVAVASFMATISDGTEAIAVSVDVECKGASGDA